MSDGVTHFQHYRRGYLTLPVIAVLMLTGFHPPGTLLEDYLAGMTLAFTYSDSIHYKLDRRSK